MEERREKEEKRRKIRGKKKNKKTSGCVCARLFVSVCVCLF